MPGAGRAERSYVQATDVNGQDNAEPAPMDADVQTQEAAYRANELYWGSKRSVNQIAEDMDLSKGALYGMIQAQPTGLGCPLCGAEVVFANRTAKDRGRLDCHTCEWDGSVDETVGYAADSDEEEALPDTLPPPPLVRTRMHTVAGGALLGAAVGLALVLWARRR